MFIKAHKFKVHNFGIDWSTDYDDFLYKNLKKAKINYVKKVLDLYYLNTDAGPIHEIIIYLNEKIIKNITVVEFNDSNQEIKKINLLDCQMVDHQIVYEYETNNYSYHWVQFNFKNMRL